MGTDATYDLATATRPATGGGFDLRRAAQMTARGPVALGKARQAPGGSAAHTVTKATSRPGGAAGPKATPARKTKRRA